MIKYSFYFLDQLFNIVFLNLNYSIIIGTFIFLMVTFDGNAVICAATGGLLLGLATSLNYIIRGKVTGMSGIFYGIISLNKSELPQKLSIVGGMFFISAIFFLIFGYNYYNGFQPFGPQNQIITWTTYPGYFLAGLLVGFGTKLSNGCTSGHGLCGLPRLSIRSIVAVCTFLLTAIGISTFSWYVGLGPFVNDPNLSPQINYNHVVSAVIFGIIGLSMPLIGYMIAKKYAKQFNPSSQVKDQITTFIVGLIFAIGLMLSGMSRRLNILQFLQLNDKWNPALLFVLGFGLLVNFITFSIMRKKGTSLDGSKVFDPKNNLIDWQLVGGAFCFGLGWGIGALCPGPFFVLFSVFTIPIQIIWGIGLIIGMKIAVKVSQIALKSKQRKDSTQNKGLLKQEEPVTKP